MTVRRYRLTRRAEGDLLAIGRYTLERWGERQTLRYLADIESVLDMLAANSKLGRACEEVRPGLRRFEKARHVIFYRVAGREIVVSRILHEKMLPKRHHL